MHMFISIHLFSSALERCAGDVIAEMLEVAESYDPDDAQMELVLRRKCLLQLFHNENSDLLVLFS